MNTFHDLLDRYATLSGGRVDRREWLMLLELDPTTAAEVMAHLSILAAEDLTLQLAEQAQSALAAAAARADATGGDSASIAAHAALSAFTDRITQARARAWTNWTDQVQPRLRDAGVLLEVTVTTIGRPAQRWVEDWVRLPGVGTAYPARIAARRRCSGYPIVRFDLDTCRRIATDINAARAADTSRRGPSHLLAPAVLVDADRPTLVAAANTLDDAWAADAAVLHPDGDGLFGLGSRHWPWQHEVNGAKSRSATAWSEGRSGAVLRLRSDA